MSTLVVGASGLIGYEFYRQNKERNDWHFTYNTHKLKGFMHLDATNQSEVYDVVNKIKPKTLILPAALSNVNRCEVEHEIAYKNNVGIVKNFINALNNNSVRAKIVFFSTDYLFDGTSGPYSEDSQPNPINFYGKLKLMCEKEIISSGLDYLIIRTTVVFGWEMQRKNFLYRVIDTLKRNRKLFVPNDQYGNPTYVRDLVYAVDFLLEKGYSGVYNVVGDEYINRESFAKKIALFFGLDENLIVGKPTSYFKNVAPRPLLGGLKNDKIHKIGITMKNVEEALSDMLKRKSEDDVYHCV